jgi:hypothetical protein
MGRLWSRVEAKRVDVLLSYKSNIPFAVSGQVFIGLFINARRSPQFCSPRFWILQPASSSIWSILCLAFSCGYMAIRTEKYSFKQV